MGFVKAENFTDQELLNFIKDESYNEYLAKKSRQGKTRNLWQRCFCKRSN